MEKTDFAPFKGLADVPLAMTAHILFPQIDPERPATTSPIVISEIVRGYIGYQGLIVSDDVTMAALSDPIENGLKQQEKLVVTWFFIVMQSWNKCRKSRSVAVKWRAIRSRAGQQRSKVKDAPINADLKALAQEHSVLMEGANT